MPGPDNEVDGSHQLTRASGLVIVSQTAKGNDCISDRIFVILRLLVDLARISNLALPF
jgi:hypothetical protein